MMVCSLTIIYMFAGSPDGPFKPKHLLAFYGVSLPFSILVSLAVERLGSKTADLLYSNRRSTNPTGVFSADIERVRHCKRKGEYDDALHILEGVIERGGGSPEALFLKAQILWEGFANARDAKHCLTEVMKAVPNGETLHSWASNYYAEIIGSQKA